VSANPQIHSSRSLNTFRDRTDHDSHEEIKILSRCQIPQITKPVPSDHEASALRSRSQWSFRAAENFPNASRPQRMCMPTCVPLQREKMAGNPEEQQKCPATAPSPITFRALRTGEGGAPANYRVSPLRPRRTASDQKSNMSRLKLQQINSMDSQLPLAASARDNCYEAA